MIENYAIISSDGLVMNVIAYDGNSGYRPDAGMTMVKSDVAVIGDTYINGQFIKQLADFQPADQQGEQ